MSRVSRELGVGSEYCMLQGHLHVHVEAVKKVSGQLCACIDSPAASWIQVLPGDVPVLSFMTYLRYFPQHLPDLLLSQGSSLRSNATLGNNYTKTFDTFQFSLWAGSTD